VLTEHRTNDEAEGYRRDVAPALPHPRVPLFTEAEVAALLHLSPTTLKKWRRTGRGPLYYRFGSAIRYRHEDLDEFVRRAAVPPRST